MKDLLIILFAAPVAAVMLSFTVQAPRLSEYATVIAALIDLTVSIPLLLRALYGPVVLAHSYVQVDLLGTWVILCISIVYTLSSIYAVGYMRLLGEESRLPLFYGLFSGFAFTMLAACVVNNVGVFWIAIELTTLISTFLVGFEREAESTEAAWKYIVVVSGGISLALLGTVLFYWGGSFVLGPSYAMTWAALASICAFRLSARSCWCRFCLSLSATERKQDWRLCIPGYPMRIANLPLRFLPCSPAHS